MNTRTDPAAPADDGFYAGPESDGSDRLLAFRERFPNTLCYSETASRLQIQTNRHAGGVPCHHSNKSKLTA